MLEMRLNVFILLGFLFVFVSCEDRTKKDFYSYSYFNHGIDEVDRIPVIKPYEILTTNPSNADSWFIEMKKFHQIFGINNIGVKGSVFAFYKDECFVPNVSNGLQKIWFIVDVKSNVEMAFADEDSYKRALDSLHVSDLKLLDINKIYENFSQKGVLPSEWPQSESSNNN